MDMSIMGLSIQSVNQYVEQLGGIKTVIYRFGCQMQFPYILNFISNNYYSQRISFY